MDYVKAYLQLQKLRYGEDLQIIWKISKRALNIQVPFNFLQPIVENAFVHGFSETAGKKIKLVITKNKEFVEIQVLNTGKPVSEQACYAVNQGILSNTSHGLSMIYAKLKAAFGERCIFRMEPGVKGYTCFLIRIPLDETDTARKEKK